MNPILNFLVKNKTSIFISLTIGLLLLYFERIMNALGVFFINCLSILSDNFSMYYYYSVANYDVSMTIAHINQLEILSIVVSMLIIALYFKKTIVGHYSYKKKKFMSFFIIAVCAFVFFYIDAMFNNIVSVENKKFNKDMISLLPYVGQEEVNKLKSDWVLMENKEDYDMIIKRLEKAKNEYLKK